MQKVFCGLEKIWSGEYAGREVSVSGIHEPAVCHRLVACVGFNLRLAPFFIPTLRDC